MKIICIGKLKFSKTLPNKEETMIKKSRFYAVLFVLAIVFALMGFIEIAEAGRGGSGGRGDGPIVYVTSQGLFYDSIVTADPLPQKGPFQLLEINGPSGLQTEFGPGDPDYFGGRWWMDVNDNGEMDEGDHFFSCPLLGSGRDTP
jgi:hypothetical protein